MPLRQESALRPPDAQAPVHGGSSSADASPARGGQPGASHIARGSVTGRGSAGGPIQARISAAWRDGEGRREA
eukprot:5829009-Pyramimonas_sp.AAC.1